MAAGAAWMVAARLFDRGLGLISTLILARLLVPADFGLIAMATSVVALLDAFTSFGFDAALIRQPAARREHFDTTWTLHLLVAAIVGASLLLAAFPAAWFFDEEKLVPVMVAIAGIAIVRGFENVGVTALEKELRFRRAFVFIAAKKAAMIGTAIPLAFVLADYRALLGGMGAGAVTGVALSYVLHRFRPRLSLACWRELFMFSRWLLLKNLLDFVRLRYADIVIGRVAGPGALGIYSVGADLATLPTTELIAPVNRAVFPGYALMAQDREALGRGYIAVLGLAAAIALPAAFGIAATAPLIVFTLLGPNWAAAVEVVQVLAWVGAVQVLVSNSYPVFLALGKPWIATALSFAHAALLVVVLPVAGTWWGMSGVILGLLAVNVALFPVGIGVVLRQLRLRFAAFLAAVLGPAISSAFMYAAVSAFVGGVDDRSNAPALLLAIALGCVSYVIVLGAIWWIRGRPDGAESTVLHWLRSRSILARSSTP